MIFRPFFRGAEEKFGQFVEDSVAAQTRLTSGQSTVEEVESPHGTILRLTKLRDGGIQYSSAGGDVEASGRRFPQAEERPSSYPTDAPFIPNVQVSVTEIPQNGWRSISWHRVPEPTRLFAEIGKQLVDNGWAARRKRGRFFGLLGFEKHFTKDGETQRLILLKLPGGRRKLQLIRRSRPGRGSDVVTKTTVLEQTGFGRFGNSRSVMRQRREQRWYGAPEIETGDAGAARNDWSLSSGVRHHRRLNLPTPPQGIRHRSPSSEASPQGSIYSPNQPMR